MPHRLCLPAIRTTTEPAVVLLRITTFILQTHRQPNHQIIMSCLSEAEGKMCHDPVYTNTEVPATGIPVEESVTVQGPVIVGAGPAGLAMGALLGESGVPYVLLERYSCIGSLWRYRTYSRLCLHLPKQFCQLPLMPFPSSFPKYPSREQFLDYLESYAKRFDIKPKFNQLVLSAEYTGKLWCVRTQVVVYLPVDGQHAILGNTITTYWSRWLVVATGENAEPVMPEIEGKFEGSVLHSSQYENGETFAGKRVLVIGCGNSGMEVSLDLSNYNANACMVVRNAVHVLPRQILWFSTFELSMWLLKWCHVQNVDRFILFMSWMKFGDTATRGIPRPSMGPMELKNVTGKTPVLDVGAMEKIKSGKIEVYPGIKCFRKNSVEFIDGRIVDIDNIIFATGYKSNVPYWLKENQFFSKKDGFPKKSKEWKGENGLYAIGFSKRGLLGVNMESIQISKDIVQIWSTL